MSEYTLRDKIIDEILATAFEKPLSCGSPYHGRAFCHVCAERENGSLEIRTRIERMKEDIKEAKPTTGQAPDCTHFWVYEPALPTGTKIFCVYCKAPCMNEGEIEI